MVKISAITRLCITCRGMRICGTHTFMRPSHHMRGLVIAFKENKK